MARVVILLFLIVITAISAEELQCGENEVFDSCGLKCQGTCINPIPRACTLACTPGCHCINGYVRNAKSKCVELRNCY